MKAAEYEGIHHWLRMTYGSANRCENIRCPKSSTRFEWALKKGRTHSKDRASYKELCKSCHAAYDLRWHNFPNIDRPTRQVHLSLKHYEAIRRLAYKLHKPMTAVLEEIIAAKKI